MVTAILVAGSIAAIILWRRFRSPMYGWLALIASGALLFGAVLYEPISHHEPANSTICITRMNTLGKAMLMYAGDYDDKLPHIDWSDTLTEYAGDLNLACPESDADVAYSLNFNLPGKDFDFLAPESVVVFFESETGPNSQGGPSNVAWRHKGSAYFLFADGHVSGLTPDKLPEPRWK